jgi:hypothetical protein
VGVGWLEVAAAFEVVQPEAAADYTAALSKGESTPLAGPYTAGPGTPNWLVP